MYCELRLPYIKLNPCASTATDDITYLLFVLIMLLFLLLLLLLFLLSTYKAFQGFPFRRHIFHVKFSGNSRA